jgi:hypothetical protein
LSLFRFSLSRRLDPARELTCFGVRLYAVFLEQAGLPLGVDPECSSAITPPVEQPHEPPDPFFIVGIELARPSPHDCRRGAISTFFLETRALPSGARHTLAEGAALLAQPLLELLCDPFGKESLEQFSSVERQRVTPTAVAQMSRKSDGIAP